MRVLIVVTLLVSSLSILKADPTRGYGSWSHTTIGLRVGWVGAPNGLSVRHTINNGHAFEFVAGYNPKYGRHAEMPAYRKGNSFLSASYSPHFTVIEGNTAMALYANVGLRMNVHHYRSFNFPAGGSPITADVFGGGGLQLEFSEKVEVFGDMHVKYFSAPGNAYIPGMESGAGIRFWLN